MHNTVDEVGLLNKCWSLKKENKITEEHDNHIRSNSNNDPLLISYDFRNNLINKINPNFEVKYTLPFARNLTNSREYLFLGYTESKKLNGVYMFATNEYHSEYPIFIDSNIKNIISNLSFENYKNQITYNYTETIEKLIEEKYRFQIQNFIVYPDIEELNYDYDEYEKQKQIDQDYLNHYLSFLSNHLRNTMGKENEILFDEEFIRFKVSKSGLDFQFQLPLKMIENTVFLMKRINNELNTICHYNQRFRPENFGFYNFKNFTGCIPVNKAIELLKDGILDRELFHSLPLRAFSPSKPKILNMELMKLIEKEGWDENTIQTFLNDFS